MILNTLDRFLIRREQPVQQALQPSREGNQAASGVEQQAGGPPDRTAPAEEPAAPAGPGSQRPAAGTLDGFLVRRDATAEASTSGRVGSEELQWQALPRALLHRQVSGRLPQGVVAYARHCEALSLQQLAALSTHAWGRPALSARGPVSIPPEGREGGASIQALQFDAGGELLVAASDEGVLSVHSMQQLMQALARGAGGGLLRSPPAAADPLLVLDCGMPRLHSVRWDPGDLNVVGVTSTATRQLLLFDLEHTQGRPKLALSVPAQSASLGSVAVGLTDLAFPGDSGSGSGGSAYTVMAGGMGGQVFLWDQRARPTPHASLHSQHSGAIHCLQLAAGGRLVVAGTQGGEVRVWDLRGGSSGTLRFGGTVHHHPLLESISLRAALTAVPGLADQTSIPASTVQWLQSDPLDERRLGFHLGCGWSGVLDLAQREITHLHAPPAPDAVGWNGAAGAAANEYAPALHRRPCWSAGGTQFLAPSRHSDALLLLDFAPGRHAACAVYPPGASPEGRGGSRGSGQGPGRGAEAAALPPAVEVRLSQPAVCVAAHPGGDMVVAGGRAGRLSVMTGW